MLGVIPYNKKLLPAIAHYIFIKIFQQIKHKGIIIIFDDLADTTLVKLSFLEWKKILSSFQEYSWIKKIKVFCLFMQQNKMIDFDSIIELFQLTTKIENISPDEKICVLLQQSILQEKILSKPIEENIYKGMNLNFENFITTMTKFGYTRKEYVESIGEFAVRGNIIDIWANGFLVSKETLHQENKKLRTPARIVLDDNVVVHIKQFDITTQRSFPHQEFEKIEIYPVNFEYFDKILSQAY
ncbi:MAG: hypothetical protein NZ839_03025, partial [Endomicrobia bacterium]|nr:hypothetical protein [Endomicrobiia bacterium]